jgi:PST family polysaccharide transporter
LANILAPTDFGLRGIILVVIGLLSWLADLGLGSALVHEETVTRVQFSTLFYLNFLAGLILAAALCVLAGPIAVFFRDERLTALLRVMALTFVIGSICPIFAALLQKELNFKARFQIDLTEMVINGLASIAFALRGFGVWSLVYGYLLGSIVRAFMFWRSASLRPNLAFSLKSVDKFLKFGLYVYGEQILYFFTRNLDNIIIGRFLGAEALGYYSLAYSLMLTPVSRIGETVHRVIFPAFSLIQHDDQRLREGYKKVVKFVSTLTFPMMAGMFAVAPQLIAALYGKNWMPTVGVLQVFCIVGAIQSVVYLASLIQYSKGRSDIGFKWNLLSLALDTAAFFIGLRWGIMGVAVAYTSLALVLEPIIQGITNRLIKLSWRDFLRQFKLQTYGAAAILGLAIGFKMFVGIPLRMGATSLLIAMVVLGFAAYSAIFLWKGRDMILELAGMAGIKLGKVRTKTEGLARCGAACHLDPAGAGMLQLSMVIPTKDRPEKLHRLLSSLLGQTRRPEEIIIVDGGRIPVSDICRDFEDLNIKYIRSVPPSSSRQRNKGVEIVAPQISHVGFLDDDCILEKDAISKMFEFWATAPSNTAGAAFNMLNYPQMDASFLKTLPLFHRLGIYSLDPGRVSASGFHIMIGKVARTICVQWLPSGAAVWKRSVFEKHRFDEWYDGYGYLEDLDFSYEIGKEHKLAVVACAGYRHFPDWGDRQGKFGFGRKEVLNRLYFVRKHPEISIQKCYVTLVLRTLISSYLGFVEPREGNFRRALGNICGLLGI